MGKPQPLSALEQRIADLYGQQLQDCSTSLVELQKQSQTASLNTEKRLDELKTQLEAHEKELDQLTNAFSTWSTKRDDDSKLGQMTAYDLYGSIGALGNEVTSLQKQLSSLASDMAQFKQAFEANSKIYNSAVTHFQSLTSEVRELRSQVQLLNDFAKS